MLCSFYEPRSIPAESYRQLRTALQFNRIDAVPRVILVAGLSADDGASTVAANLAISVALIGKRVLLIDANLCQPRQQQLFGISHADTGLAAMVTSDREPNDVIVQTAVENLWLLPAGSVPTSPRELFTSPRFGELLHLVRDSYDHVFIDTEPLLSATDPRVIAPQTDGVVLTLKPTRDSRRRSKQAIAVLDRLPCEHTGHCRQPLERRAVETAVSDATV